MVVISSASEPHPNYLKAQQTAPTDTYFPPYLAISDLLLAKISCLTNKSFTTLINSWENMGQFVQ